MAGVSPLVASRAAAHAAPVDLFVDAASVLTTTPQPRLGQIRSLPTGAGAAPGRVWALPLGPGLPARLAELLQEEPPTFTARALAVCELVASCNDTCSGLLVPVPRTGRAGTTWAWQPAPDARAGAALARAVAAAVRAGAVLGSDAEATAWDFAGALSQCLVPAGATAELPSAAQLAGAGRASLRRWAGHVRARRLGGARLALSVNPPEAIEAPWTLLPLAVKLDEPTTRMPAATAPASLFGAAEEQWAAWRSAEGEALSRAWGRRLPDVRTLVGSGQRADLEPAEVLELLDDVAPRIVESGFDVLAPDGLLHRATVRRRLRATTAATGELAAGRLGLVAEALVDGQALTEDEYELLAAAKGELVSIRGRWVRVEAGAAAQLRALAARLAQPTSAADLLIDEAFDGVDLSADQLLPSGLRPAREVQPDPRIKANLRPYQVAGLAWLTWLGDNQVGGILADDMGLGKTLQVLAWIARDAAEGTRTGPTLVVCPVTLVDTWLRQSAQFTPHLRITAHHGGGRGQAAHAAAECDVVVTTYGILAREPDLARIPWRRVVLDEAQAIKNPDTQAARAARALQAPLRLAVTGTPVENHVGDLWSLLAFAQPGLLPRRKAFEKSYIGGTPADLSRLRAVVAPFVLRRAKTDPGILPDLPDREVVRADATLTREQVGAYEAVVADMLGTLETLRAKATGQTPAASSRATAEQLSRRATVLGSITRLKQICVHPALLTESRSELAGRSGKVDQLVELCAEIVDEGQAVVVFTQFASFVPDLAAHLRATLGVEVATLTGSDSRTARSATVAQFSRPDGPPILLASLKAGGTGLTLVRANHVIHLDRWWNPAVEDQASDRVWRIGQDQKVTVHVLVCPGTLEDRIDAALANKRAVAGAIVRSTDTAITELSDSDLGDLVRLVRERVLQ